MVFVAKFFSSTFVSTLVECLFKSNRPCFYRGGFFVLLFLFIRFGIPSGDSEDYKPTIADCMANDWEMVK